MSRAGRAHAPSESPGASSEISERVVQLSCRRWLPVRTNATGYEHLATTDQYSFSVELPTGVHRGGRSPSPAAVLVTQRRCLETVVDPNVATDHKHLAGRYQGRRMVLPWSDHAPGEAPGKRPNGETERREERSDKAESERY